MLRNIGIRLRLILVVAVSLLVINAAIGGYYYLARNQLERDLDEKLTGIAEYVAGELRGEFLAALGPGDEDTRTYKNLSARLVNARDTFNLHDILIVTTGSDVVVDAGGRLAIGDHAHLLDASPREVAKATRGQGTTTVVYRGDDDKPYKSAFAPIRNTDGHVSGVLVVEASAGFLREFAVFRRVIVVIATISVAVMILLGVIVSMSVISPILTLAAATDRLRDGNYSVVKPRGGGELERLMRSFNDMSRRLEENEAKLKALLKHEQERAEESEQYAAALLSSIANGVVTIDREGHVSVCNDEASRILDVDSRDVTGRHYQDVAALGPMREMMRASLDRGETIRDETVELRVGNGQVAHVSASSAPLDDPHGLAANLVLTDQTALIRLQEQVKRQETLAAVGELAAHVAHEVRNPLGSIKIYMDLLARRSLDRLKREEYFNKVREEIARLDTIVSEFLDYSAPADIKPSEFDLVDVIENAVLFARQDDKAQNISVSGNYRELGPVNICADRNQIMQMFLNLVINARDAMPDGGTIDVTLGSKTHRTQDDGVEIVITDTGPGIKAADRDRIFEPFYSTKSKGTGLGLALVQRVIDNHNGTIDIESPAGGGAVVRVSLPLSQQSEAATG